MECYDGGMHFDGVVSKLTSLHVNIVSQGNVIEGEMSTGKSSVSQFLGEVYFPTVRALRCGFGEEAGILRLATRGVAVDNITGERHRGGMSTGKCPVSRFLFAVKRSSPSTAQSTEQMGSVALLARR